MNTNMKNIFFQRAFKQAIDVTAHKSRLLRLVAQLLFKLQQVNWKDANTHAIKSKFFVFGRLSKAYASGQYRHIPLKAILIVVAAIIYFVNPLDLLPDIIPIAGFTDDFAILLWAYSSINSEISKFLEWERSHQPLT